MGEIIANLASTTAIANLGDTIPSSDPGCKALHTEATRIKTADENVTIERLCELLNDFTYMADIVTGGTSNFDRTFNFDGTDPSG